MEKMRVMYKLAIAMALLMIPVLSKAIETESEKTKRIVKTYALSAATYVEIENKYGDIDVEVWDKDSIKFDILITVHSDKEDELADMLKQVQINLKATSAFVLATTDWSEEVGLFKKEILKINQKVKSNSRFTINYKIKIPERIDLSLTNKFGNIFMSNYSGKLSIDISYGDFRAHRLSNVKQFNAKYGKVKIKELNYGRIELQSVKPFDVDKCIELDMESSSSEIEIDQIKNLTINSSHDDVLIEKIESITSTSSMSDFTIANLQTKILATSKYGSFKLMNVSGGCEKITIEATKTDIEIKIPAEFAATTELLYNDNSYFTNNAGYIEVSSEVDANGYYHATGMINRDGKTEVYIKNINGYIQFDVN